MLSGKEVLGAVHWVGAVTLGAEGSYLSYPLFLHFVCGATMFR